MAADTHAERGLTEDEAARRLAAAGGPARPATSRSYASIIRANVLTVFNAILLALGALTLLFADPRDSLFLGVVVSNAAIGIFQEVRAKRALDRLSALVAPHGTVLRDGSERSVPAEEIVAGDLVLIAGGDQIVADGVLARADAIRLDESILTGESRPVEHGADDEIRSGAFVVEGVGEQLVTAAGADSYAERIAGQARVFRHPRSPLELGLNKLLVMLVIVMVPLASALVISLVARHTALHEAIPKAVAAMVSLIPEGLILLASLTFAVAAARMARRGALAQQLNAIESLAAVDVVCLDKTGTLTDATLRVVATIPADGVQCEQLERSAGRFGASSQARNLTLQAICERWPADAEPVLAQVPFLSRRRWSALEFDDGALVLGTPEALAGGALRRAAGEQTAAGRRVVALARAPRGELDGDADDGLPGGLEVLGLIVLAESLRADARETVEFLYREGVQLRVLSGDAPATVAAIAADAGVDLRAGPLVGSDLPADADELRRVLEQHTVIGRISPEDKRRVVEALRDGGSYVAMVGDGVNDVPALKAARLSIAQGSGAHMATAVADIVLVDGDFSIVPRLVYEGRQILRNVQRVAKLFVSKTAFAAVLIVTIGMTADAYPFLPRHLTLSSTFAIGVPAFFLALAPSEGPWRTTSFLRDVAGFAVPAGIALAGGVLAAYALALDALDLTTAAARTVATTVLTVSGLYLILVLEGSHRRRQLGVQALCLTMLAGYAIAIAVGPLRRFYALTVPGWNEIAASAIGVAVAVVLVRAGLAVAARRWA